MMGSFVYFFILLIILQVLSPLLYAYPIVGLLLWVGIIGWFLYRNKKQREAFYKAQQQQQDYYQQQQQQLSLIHILLAFVQKGRAAGVNARHDD